MDGRISPAFFFEETGIDTGFSRPGGLGFCLTQEEFEAKRSAMTRLAEQTEELFKFEMLNRGGVAGLLPWIGGEIAGAVYCPHDGGANPLNLLRALQSVLAKSGATLIAGGKVRNIVSDGFGYSISTDEGKSARRAFCWPRDSAIANLRRKWGWRRRYGR